MLDVVCWVLEILEFRARQIRDRLSRVRCRCAASEPALEPSGRSSHQSPPPVSQPLLPACSLPLAGGCDGRFPSLVGCLVA